VLHGEGCPRRPGRVSPARWDEPLGKPLPANGDAFKRGRGGRGFSATVCAAQSSVQPSSRWMRPTAPRGKCSGNQYGTATSSVRLVDLATGVCTQQADLLNKRISVHLCSRFQKPLYSCHVAILGGEHERDEFLLTCGANIFADWLV